MKCYPLQKGGGGQKRFSHAEGGDTISSGYFLTQELVVLAILKLGTKSFHPLKWPLTPKLDRATSLFLKFDMRYGAYRHATGLSKI